MRRKKGAKTRLARSVFPPDRSTLYTVNSVYVCFCVHSEISFPRMSSVTVTVPGNMYAYPSLYRQSALKKQKVPGDQGT